MWPTRPRAGHGAGPGRRGRVRDPSLCLRGGWVSGSEHQAWAPPVARASEPQPRPLPCRGPGSPGGTTPGGRAPAHTRGLAQGAGGWRAAPAPGLVPNGPRPAQDGREAWADVVIVAHVLVLLLTPHQLRAWVRLCLSLDQVERKRRDLGQGRKNEGQSQGKGGTPTDRPPGEQPPPSSLAPAPARCPETGGWRLGSAHQAGQLRGPGAPALGV